MTDLDKFYLQQDEPIRGSLLALRQIILSQDKDVVSAWKYGMPFFCFRGKMFCYLWIHRKFKQPYLGIVEGKRFDHPALISEKRSRMKVMLFDPNKDLPIDTVNSILRKAIDFYKTGNNLRLKEEEWAGQLMLALWYFQLKIFEPQRNIRTQPRHGFFLADPIVLPSIDVVDRFKMTC